MRRLALLLSLLAACHAPTRTAAATKTHARVERYSEPSAVTALAPAGGSLYVATTGGLDRWDLKDESGARVHLGSGDGVPTTGIRALVAGPGPNQKQLWFATDTQIGRFDVAARKATILPAPPPSMAPALSGLRAMVADRRSGLWIAAQSGVYFVDADGKWTDLNLKREVTSLWIAPGDVLWVGTPDGVIQRNPGGVFTHYGERHGLAIRHVALVAEGPDGAPVAFGEGRIATYADGAWATFRAAPELTITAAAGRPGVLIAASTDGLVSLSPTEPRPEDPAAVKLVHVAGKREKSPYGAVRLAGELPPDLTALALWPGSAESAPQVALGTRTLGTAVVAYPREAAPQERWLRARELMAGARSLSVACRDKTECYVATGANAAWQWNGQTFTRLANKPTITIIAVTRSPQGEVQALFREPGEHMLHVAKLEKGTFTPVADLKIATPNGPAALSFAKFSPDGLLWLGLEYLDQENDPRPYGVAIVDLGTGSVTYHREDASKNARKNRILPIPVDVVDVAFLKDEVWFASGSGAVRLKGEHVKVWTEANELKSEILRAVVATEGGEIFVASGSGVGEYDGKHWAFPDALSLTVTGIAHGADGRLWVGTETGMITYDGKGIEHFGDEKVLDVTVDHFGRVWARGADTLTLYTPL